MAINGPSTELQQMASLAGLIYWDGASGLSLHPKYGSWFALRAVLIFDGLDYTGKSCSPAATGLQSGDCFRDASASAKLCPSMRDS